jgi:hypothetical protein
VSAPADYLALLAAKAVAAPMRGLAAAPDLAPHLFPFQRECVDFALRAGSAGIFLDTGLGKTLVELEWCRHAAAASNGMALILTPLAVARQIEREAKRFGYDDVRVIREQSDVRLGTNICNYDRLDKLDASAFGAVALDESSVLKNFTGKTTRTLISLFEGHRWKLSATATPAPNDHMELGQQCEFLSVMASNEMLARWFISDQTEMGRYRLRGHAVSSFWDWMASWSRMAEHPRDLGDDVEGFDLPPLRVTRHEAEAATVETWGDLFDAVSVSATTLHDVKRRTASSRAATAATIAMESADPCVIWCDTDYEADALLAEIGAGPGVAEVRGSHPIERKESALAAFADGSSRVLISKPSVCGYGLNWQHCARMVFMGRSFSYESYYQAVRRCWRFGQTRPVEVHLVVADSEDHIGEVIDRKAADHTKMKAAMVGAMRRARGVSSAVKVPYLPTHEGRLPVWL